MSEFLFGPVPHQEAIDFIKSKPVVSRNVFDGLLPELRGRAFAIAGLEGHANVSQAIRDRIADLPAGHDWDKVKKDIANDLSPFLVDPTADPDEHDAQVAAANRRAELLLRTHGFQAYQAAEYQVMDRQRDVMPFWQYHSMEDSAVRPEHAALDKLVLPADSPFWNNHFPPWDWGCRCQAIPITQDDRDDIAQADQKRSPDARLVMEGPQLTHLEQGTLVRHARTYDVRSPVEKEGGSGFSWDPATLKLPLEQLEQRFDPVVWQEWKAWAQATPMGPNQPTVWDWLAGSAPAPALLPREAELLAELHQGGTHTPQAHFFNRDTGASKFFSSFDSSRLTASDRADIKRVGGDTLLMTGGYGLPIGHNLKRYLDLGIDHVRVVMPDGGAVLLDGLQGLKGPSLAKVTTALDPVDRRDPRAYVQALQGTALKATFDDTIREQTAKAEAARQAALPTLDLVEPPQVPLPPIPRKAVGWMGAGSAQSTAEFAAAKLRTPQSPDFLNHWNRYLKLTPAQFVQHLTQDLDLDLRYTTLRLDGSNGRFNLVIDGRLANGGKIYVDRDIDFTRKHVHHSYFKLDGAKQGQDTGKTLFRNLVGFYDHWGIKDISVHANIDVGGYAWLRYGFLPDSARSVATYAINQWDALKRRFKFSARAIQEVEALLRSPDPMAMRRLSAMRTKVGERTVAKPDGTTIKQTITLGQALFLDSNWHGTLDLTKPVEFTYFATYIGYH